jgi:hypothetical protein
MENWAIRQLIRDTLENELVATLTSRSQRRPEATYENRLVAPIRRADHRSRASTVRCYEHRRRFHVEGGSHVHRSRCGGLRCLCADQVRNKWWEASCLGNPESYGMANLCVAGGAFRPRKHRSMGRVGWLWRRLCVAIDRSYRCLLRQEKETPQRPCLIDEKPGLFFHPMLVQ